MLISNVVYVLNIFFNMDMLKQERLAFFQILFLFFISVVKQIFFFY